MSSNAVLDPWCPVSFADHGNAVYLFGYMVTHPSLGGLAWARTSEIEAMAGSEATTRSGTTYRLGERIHPARLPNEEARLALELLTQDAPPSKQDQAWLTACKMSRWLCVCPPDRGDLIEILEWIAEHEVAYQAARITDQLRADG